MIERKNFIDRINEISSDIHKDITDGSEVLKIEYDSNVPYCEDREELKKIYENMIQESIGHDIDKGNTLHGPHKDDLKVSINGIDARKFGSQGQQRTAALSLKLAEISLIEDESGEKPILILDDVLSELDKSRQSYLIGALEGLQIFLTSTDVSEEVLEKFSNRTVFEIKDGSIRNVDI